MFRGDFYNYRGIIILLTIEIYLKRINNYLNINK